LAAKNDPLLDIYLQDKEQYQLSKQFSIIASTTSNEIKADALDGLLRNAAWKGDPGSWEDSCKIALDGAMTTHLKTKTEKPKKTDKSKKNQASLHIFEKSSDDGGQ